MEIEIDNNITIDVNASRDPELAISAGLMMSDDPKERLIAEYIQAKRRYNEIMDATWRATIEEEEQYVPIELCDMQSKVLEEYVGILKIRARIMGVELPTKYKVKD